MSNMQSRPPLKRDAWFVFCQRTWSRTSRFGRLHLLTAWEIINIVKIIKCNRSYVTTDKILFFLASHYLISAVAWLPYLRAFALVQNKRAINRYNCRVGHGFVTSGGYIFVQKWNWVRIERYQKYCLGYNFAGACRKYNRRLCKRWL